MTSLNEAQGATQVKVSWHKRPMTYIIIQMIPVAMLIFCAVSTLVTTATAQLTFVILSCSAAFLVVLVATLTIVTGFNKRIYFNANGIIVEKKHLRILLWTDIIEINCSSMSPQTASSLVITQIITSSGKITFELGDIRVKRLKGVCPPDVFEEIVAAREDARWGER